MSCASPSASARSRPSTSSYPGLKRRACTRPPHLCSSRPKSCASSSTPRARPQGARARPRARLRPPPRPRSARSARDPRSRPRWSLASTARSTCSSSTWTQRCARACPCRGPLRRCSLSAAIPSSTLSPPPRTQRRALTFCAPWARRKASGRSKQSSAASRRRRRRRTRSRSRRLRWSATPTSPTSATARSRGAGPCASSRARPSRWRQVPSTPHLISSSTAGRRCPSPTT
mmetsp:Transcript_18104/g.56760  ORF Transcript_18104/g.56760 Transcript_18104/m.56760 type:complete len:231 (-) Transcript_18104:4003-4695(-)